MTCCCLQNKRLESFTALIFALALLSIPPILAQNAYSDCSIYGNCKPVVSARAVNNNTFNINSSTYFQGYTPADFWKSFENQNSLTGNKTGSFNISTTGKVSAGFGSFFGDSVSGIRFAKQTIDGLGDFPMFNFVADSFLSNYGVINTTLIVYDEFLPSLIFYDASTGESSSFFYNGSEDTLYVNSNMRLNNNYLANISSITSTGKLFVGNDSGNFTVNEDGSFVTYGTGDYFVGNGASTTDRYAFKSLYAYTLFGLSAGLQFKDSTLYYSFTDTASSNPKMGIGTTTTLDSFINGDFCVGNFTDSGAAACPARFAIKNSAAAPNMLMEDYWRGRTGMGANANNDRMIINYSFTNNNTNKVGIMRKNIWILNVSQGFEYGIESTDLFTGGVVKEIYRVQSSGINLSWNNITQVNYGYFNYLNVTNTSTLGSTNVQGTLNVSGNVNITGNLVIGGNLSVKRPYAVFTDNFTQAMISTTAGQAMNFTVTEDNYLISLQGKQNITVQQTGDYLFEVSALAKCGNNNKHINVWWQKTNATNGFSNVARSNTLLELPTANVEALMTIPFIIDLNTTDKLRIMWNADDTGCSLIYYTNTSFIPETPSIILVINKISEITP
jgi:hypothetical protein